MYNLIIIKGIMRYSLPTISIDKIDLCIADIKIQLYYYLILHVGQRYLNRLKDILYLERSAIGQLIIFSKSIMIWKRSPVIATLSLKHNQVMSKTYNAGSPSMKILTIIKT